jgi:hypothetical protein
VRLLPSRPDPGVALIDSGRMAETSGSGFLHGAIPFPPMEAELVRELPVGDGWQYEPER